MYKEENFKMYESTETLVSRHKEAVISKGTVQTALWWQTILGDQGRVDILVKGGGLVPAKSLLEKLHEYYNAPYLYADLSEEMKSIHETAKRDAINFLKTGNFWATKKVPKPIELQYTQEEIKSFLVFAIKNCGITTTGLTDKKAFNHVFAEWKKYQYEESKAKQ